MISLERYPIDPVTSTPMAIGVEFGCSSESAEDSRDWYGHYKERFLDTADPDWILTIVDCHI